ncbi:LuxR C-terminal-related transcriptional regulator [Streptomyces sp. NBC_01443]|uniref:helix-turn-helix transcriptional regulator n=1 Tax=Streptomyces sp. NBC_01443 TaxID=2903868 RepID=UPI002256F0DA|nr:LuxR C-terminal-related transcriptional regulator [Streptomyces sp. NBC_01443]MCX4626898.1 LuxR C-terminal-related transcriptional regulator [Streptomyces sp. NBC_01443]
MSAVAELTRESAPVRVPAAPDRLSLLRQAGDGRMPYPALVRLLGTATTAGTAIGIGTGSAAGATAGAAPGPRSAAPPDAPRLTARQTAVLTLMAEGHGNAVIARTLSCSEHTIKNVIYELMSRLQARNRAHAVACAVRHSLI